MDKIIKIDTESVRRYKGVPSFGEVGFFGQLMVCDRKSFCFKGHEEPLNLQMVSFQHQVVFLKKKKVSISQATFYSN